MCFEQGPGCAEIPSVVSMMHAFVFSGVGFFTGYTLSVSINRIVTEPKSLADTATALNDRPSAKTTVFIQPPMLGKLDN